MDQLHDPLIKQCITSLALNNNMLKHSSSDNFCFLKSDHAMNYQPSKTVSLYLTRVPNASSSYVHVLRCNLCDHLTLNTANFKEHFRMKHPSSLGFWTYSCCQCSSMSTEKSLMEEHMKLYHRVNDGPAGKLIERFHEPNANEPSTGINQAATIPLTLTSSGAPTLTPSGLAFNLLNVIQNAGRNQSSPAILPFNNKTCTINGTVASISPPSVSPPLAASPPEVPSPVVECNPGIKAEDQANLTISNDVAVTTMGVAGYCISGSRRRKATTPGRICPTSSANSTSNEQSDLDEEVKPIELEPTVSSTASELDTMTSETSSTLKRMASSCEIGPVSDTLDGTVSVSSPPSPKRFCASDVSKPDCTATCIESRPPSKAPTTTSNFPFILSIANPTDGSSSGLLHTKPLSSNLATCSQTVGTLQNGGQTMMGQLIPISGLPEQLLCGISTTLVGGSTGHNTPITQSLINTPVTFSLPMLDNQQAIGNTGSTSAWLLTNQANLNTVPSAITTFQPTLLVPVPNAINETLSLPNLRPISASSVEFNASGGNVAGHTPNVVRLSDLLDALKSVTSGGGLVTSISVPFNNSLLTTTVPPSGLSETGSAAQHLLCTTAPNHLGTDNVSAAEPVTSFRSNVSINQESFPCNLPSTNIVTTPTLSAAAAASSPPTANTTSVSALLNQLVMAAVAAVNSSSAPFDTSRSTPNSGHVTGTSIASDQALDMSVRSAITPIDQASSLSTDSEVTGPTEASQNACGGKKVEQTDGISVFTTLPKVDSANTNSIHGVVEILSAALRSGLKQRLAQSCESNSANMNLSMSQCLVHPSIVQAQPNIDRLADNSSGSASILKMTTDADTNNLLRGSPGGTQATVLPLSNQSFEGNSMANSVVSMGDSGMRTTTPSIGVLCGSGGNPTILTSQPQLINLSQLQAIMSAMANCASVSIATPLSNVTGLVNTCGSPVTMSSSLASAHNSNNSNNAAIANTMHALYSPNLSSSATTQAFSQTMSQPLNSLLPTNQVLLDTASLTPLGLTQVTPHESTSAILMPNTLANVGTGLTLTTNPGALIASASQSNTCHTNTTSTINSVKITSTVPNNEGLSLANIISGSTFTSQPCVPNQALINLISSASRSPNVPQNNVALTSVAAARLLNSLTGLTSTTAAGLLPVVNTATSIATPHGTILSTPGGNMLNLLDSPQALLAAAAAAAAAASSPGHLNANHIALASLRGSILNTSNASTQRTVGSNGQVIGLLDPRTGIQLRVADVSGVSAATSSHLLTPTELVSCLSNTANDAFPQVTDGTNAAREAEHPTNGGSDKRRKCPEVDLLRTGEGDSHSPYDNHIDDGWDSGQDDSSIVQANLQSIYSAGKKAEASVESAGSSPSISGTTPTFLSSTHRRSAAVTSSRLSAISTSGRRGIGSLSDSMQLGRPHRQNFTPTQNRILTEWYQTHQAKPYPSTDDTKDLANISGLSYSQVKKWFANKRARSSSSGLPKPTPPLAPDSSPDPSAAAAIVAAAMAAATSATSISDMNDCNESCRPFSLNLQSSSALTPNSSKIEADVVSSTDESEIQPEDNVDPTRPCSPPEFEIRPTSCSHSCPSSDDEEPPLTVVSDLREEKIDSYSDRVDGLHRSDRTDPEPETSKPKHHPDSLTDQAASPPTLQVFLAPRLVSPSSKHINLDSPDGRSSPEDQTLSETVVTKEHSSCSSDGVMDEVDVLHESAITHKSKGLRTRGVILHAS